ncbi:hypothetical protein ACFWMG_23835 [Streptomyces sp. NPDC127074]|uniref:hypothetical protein n=1 Tax=Streptomyces sp. NPDC127074 TaxID=3347130 RepID=UPI00365E27EC
MRRREVAVRECEAAGAQSRPGLFAVSLVGWAGEPEAVEELAGGAFQRRIDGESAGGLDPGLQGVGG